MVEVINTLKHKVVKASNMPFDEAVLLSFKRAWELIQPYVARVLQTFYRVEAGKKRLIVYLTPGDMLINGGVMSIFSQAAKSREMLPEAMVVLSTYPASRFIYALNHEFPNHEHVWRWTQMPRLFQRFDDVMIHIPDYYVEAFYDDLGERGRATLRAVKRLSINIMDQNIWYMPGADKVSRLREFTAHLTQTCAHPKYSSQENADTFHLPTLYLPAYWDMDCYRRYPYDKKEKRIVYSPDKHPRKEEILNVLREAFPDFELYEVKDIPFPKFMDVVSRSYFCITFGEGLDGYFSQSLSQCSMGFAVYNPEFFTAGPDWNNIWNIFQDYDDLKDHIVEKMRQCLASRSFYEEHVNAIRDQLPYLKRTDADRIKDFSKRLRRFYDNDFDCYPKGWKAGQE